MKINFISLKKWNQFETSLNPFFLENDDIQGRSGGGLVQIVGGGLAKAGGGLVQVASNVVKFKKQVLGTVIG